MNLIPWRHKKTRRDPDVELRFAKNHLDRINILAAEHTRTTEAINERLRENHISQALGAWIAQSPRPGHTHRRMPWKAS